MRPWANKNAIFGITGLIFILLGGFFSIYWPFIFDHILHKELTLSPTSRAYEIWQNSSKLPVHLKIYFFNWTNPEEIENPEKKPNFVQLGPYSFLEVREKVNVTFHPENGTVSYFQRKFWRFDEKMSNGSLDDIIVQLNVVAITAARKVLTLPTMYQGAFAQLMDTMNMKLYNVKTVNELTFKGYVDHLIQLKNTVPIDGDDSPPFDRFGWFYMRNGSTMFEGHMNMETGEKDISKIGVARRWNYKDTMKFYKVPCNTVEGSGGEFWPPLRDYGDFSSPFKTNDISLFSADLCRPLTYEFKREVNHKGISGYQFMLDRKTLGNDTKKRYPHEQARYFVPTTTTEDFFSAEPTSQSIESEEDPDVVNIGQCFCNGDCSPMGLMNITACRYGAPAFVSLPHFHKADPILRERINGMNPKDDEHNFYITLEPTSGIPLDVAARLQVNILLQPSKFASFMKNVPTIYFPVFWFSLRAGLPDEMTGQMKMLVMTPSLMHYGSIALLFIGSLFVLGTAIMCYCHHGKTGSSESSTRMSVTYPNTKAELVYMDKTDNEDPQIKSNRRLYPKL